MKNFATGSIVKGFAKLGSQTKENWTRGTYIGNNKVEFWTGAVLNLPDNKIKEYKRLERIGRDYPEQSDFVNKNWENLKENIKDCMNKFFPQIKLEIDEEEHIIYALENCVSLCPAIIERESIFAFTETSTWQICVEMSYTSTLWEPSGSDSVEVSESPNHITASRIFLDTVWKYSTEDYWQNKYDDELAKEFVD
jgi:hypothetical protein